MANITFDTSGFDAGILQLGIQVKEGTAQALRDIATEILRLSQFEVPHDIGTLQNSGNVDDSNADDVLVGYNTPYAAYQHEGVRADGTHPISHWQGGRKGKYLEDPIRMNIELFTNVCKGAIGA